MTRHERLRHTLRSPVRARTVHKRERRGRALAAALAETFAEGDQARKLVTVQKRAALMPGLQLRQLFSREGGARDVRAKAESGKD